MDNNADGSTLAVDHSNGYDSPSAIGWHFVGQNVDKTKDETLYAPPVELVAGKKYKVSCVVSNTPNYTFSLDITYGTEAAQAAQTNTIHSYSGVSSGGSYAQIEETFEVSKSGRYYLAWWLHDTESNYVYFDDFRIEELLDNNLEATSVRNLNNTPSAGDKISTGVVYTNRGTTSAKSFTVQLLDNDNNVLGSSTVRRPLAAGATGTANIAWTVPDVEGTFAVRGKVLMSGDECANDDETVPVYLNVQGEGLRAVTIGTSSDVSEMCLSSTMGASSAKVFTRPKISKAWPETSTHCRSRCVWVWSATSSTFRSKFCGQHRPARSQHGLDSAYIDDQSV